MAKINFENGTTVNFEGTPTQQDVEEVALSLGIKKPEKKDGFWKGMAKDIIRPIAEVGVSEYNLAKQAVKTYGAVKKGEKTVSNEMVSRDLPFLGETKPAFTGKETTGEMAQKSAGYGLEIGSWLIGGGGASKVGVQTLKGQVLRGLSTGAKYGATAGGMIGAGQELQKGDGSAGEVALGAGLGTVGGAVLGGTLGAATPTVGKVTRKLVEPIEKRVSTVLKEAIDKGLKPTLKKSGNQIEKYYSKAAEAFNVIKKYAPEITNEEGELVAKSPSSRKEMLEALSKTKSKVFDAYHKLAIDSGGLGAQYSPKKALLKLDEVTGSKKYNPQIRNYAEKLKQEVAELVGETPDVIEARIQDYNSSLAGLYEGRVSKAQAQVDASVADIMRKELDELIEKSTGEGYQALKNEYGALKTVEKDLARQVMLEARRNPAGLIDLPSIFTGADLMIGAVTQNPAMFAKGLAGEGIKWYMKFLNNPNRYIDKAFKILEKEAVVEPGSNILSRTNKKIAQNVGLTIEDVSDKTGRSLADKMKKEAYNSGDLKKFRSLNGTFDDMLNITDSKPPRSLEPPKKTSSAAGKTGDTQYRYHTTSAKALEKIKKEGMTPSAGQYGKGVYFAPDEISTKGYGSSDEVMIRIKKDKLPKDYGEFPEQGWTESNVPPTFLEYKTKGSKKWESVTETPKKGSPAVGKTVKITEDFDNLGGNLSDEILGFSPKADNKFYDLINNDIKSGDGGLGELARKWHNSNDKKDLNSLLDAYKTKQGQEVLKTVVERIPKNNDGTISVYRVGASKEGTVSYTISKNRAEGISNYGLELNQGAVPRKLDSSLSIAKTKINPKDIVAYSPLDAEIIVKKPKTDPLTQEAKKYKSTRGENGSLPVSDIYSFQDVDRETVEMYKKKILAGEKIKPIEVLESHDGMFPINDGHHRYTAYEELGLKNAPIKYLGREEADIKIIKSQPTGTRKKAQEKGRSLAPKPKPPRKL